MATEPAPAFQFYVQEWRSSRAVQRMTFAQRGMYFEMLLEQWEHYSLPDDPGAVATLCGGTVEEWADAWFILRPRFMDRRPQRPDGRIVNARLEKYRRSLRRFKAISRKGGLQRATSAKRGKDGTYLPAGAPAARQPADQAATSTVPLSLPLTGSVPQEDEDARARDPFLNPKTTDRAARFIDRYVALYPLHRHGARYAVKPARDYAAAVTLCATWEDARLDELAVVFLNCDNEFAEQGSRTIPQFLGLASWCDSKLVEQDHKRPRPVAS